MKSSKSDKHADELRIPESGNNDPTRKNGTEPIRYIQLLGGLIKFNPYSPEWRGWLRRYKRAGFTGLDKQLGLK